MKRIGWLLLVFNCFISAICCAQETVDFNNPKIFYMGRVPMRDTAAELSWTGASVIINFKGAAVKATLNDEKGLNYYNVVIDGKVANVLKPAQGRKEYTLASGLSKGKHQLQLFKRTEYDWGRTWIFSLSVDGQLLPPPVFKHRIEYYGDSITCGMADEDTTGKDRGDNDFENGFASYANVTARYFNADMHCIAKSGIGITISWFDYVMPDIYDRAYAHDTTRWDFNKFTPEIVVINLFQNDSWLVKAKDHEQFKKVFGNNSPTPQFIISRYREFVKNIRSKYPEAKIICALGSMDATQAGSPWPVYIQEAVDGLNDTNIYTHFFAYKNTPGHPSVKEQNAMADDLIAYIKRTFKW
ncbi:SGNH/GDSL hydrolase family protein [Mucilaginibacter sp. 44-25]|uniref:SGNH/GDSL hydrolase family protein n=2 Tax=unclassified Mucilaginibacter TaxID=2617802 RepID=UPI00096592B2|nr:SGNH/GDSL hydrolase family protein [Mucilaginibacter sp. 44-25]OJW18365.1 MAG: electron transporter RnfD [Mucilaginibacter sp. 44-25]HEK20067.1 electron transporter RnfD [Bacteroidota bacterium]